MKQLQGRRALVTGAADGIGLGIAECFIDQGAEVLAVDLDAEKLAEGFDGRAGVTLLQVDVSADDAPAALIEACVNKLGGLDILVNNAGIPGELALLEDCSDENWRKVFAVCDCPGSYGRWRNDESPAFSRSFQPDRARVIRHICRLRKIDGTSSVIAISSGLNDRVQ